MSILIVNDDKKFIAHIRPGSSQHSLCDAPHPVCSHQACTLKECVPAQYSPCHSPSLCLYSPGPHTAAWALGEHALSLLSCRCAPQCQILSGKGLDPRPCCCFWPKRSKSKEEELEKKKSELSTESDRLINKKEKKKKNVVVLRWKLNCLVCPQQKIQLNLKILRQKYTKCCFSYFSYSHPKRETALTSLLISSCLSGAERAVALIMVDVWLSVSFLIQRWPATMLQTYTTGRNIQRIT